jgi:elongation factor Ts
MAVSSEMVKELRSTTGAGILDCKKALEEAEGNLEGAIEILKKRNQAVAVKKLSRDAKDGKVAAWLSGDAKLGVLAEINSETDFVARSDGFVEFVGQITAHIAGHGPCCVTADAAGGCANNLMDQKTDAGNTVRELMTDVIGRCGENIKVRRFERYETQAGRVGIYIHGEGRIGVILQVEVDQPEAAGSDELKALVKELCLQIAAMSPQYVDRASVPADLLVKEKEIAAAQLGDISKKPKEIQEKILEGKLGKWFGEVCLVEQAYIREDTKKVRDVVAEAAKALGAQVTVKRFARYALGEGL